MGRVKTKMELITSKKKSNLTFQVRSKGMKKKAYELSTLCGIEVGIIINDSYGKTNAEMWPKNEQEDGMKMLDDLITRYKNQELDQRKKRSFNSSQILKAQKDADNQLAQKTQCSRWDLSIDDMSEQELQDLNASVDMKIESVSERLQYLKDDRKGKSVITSQVSPLQEPEPYDDLDTLLDQMLGYCFECNPYNNGDDITCWIKDDDDDDDVAYNFAQPTAIDSYLQQPSNMLPLPMMMIDPSRGDFGIPIAPDLSSYEQYPSHMMPPMITIEAPTDSCKGEFECWYPNVSQFASYNIS